METKNAIVVDKKGYKVEFVLVDFSQDEKGTTFETPQFYSLQKGESLVYEKVSEAISMFKPHWNGKLWEETATPEEIEASKPKIEPPIPSAMDLLAAELSMTLAEIQTKTDMAIAELSMAIAAKGAM